MSFREERERPPGRIKEADMKRLLEMTSVDGIELGFSKLVGSGVGFFGPLRAMFVALPNGKGEWMTQAEVNANAAALIDLLDNPPG